MLSCYYTKNINLFLFPNTIFEKVYDCLSINGLLQLFSNDSGFTTLSLMRVAMSDCSYIEAWSWTLAWLDAWCDVTFWCLDWPEPVKLEISHQLLSVSILNVQCPFTGKNVHTVYVNTSVKNMIITYILMYLKIHSNYMIIRYRITQVYRCARLWVT